MVMAVTGWGYNVTFQTALEAAVTKMLAITIDILDINFIKVFFITVCKWSLYPTYYHWDYFTLS
jgi:hypothetical protein